MIVLTGPNASTWCGSGAARRRRRQQQRRHERAAIARRRPRRRRGPGRRRRAARADSRALTERRTSSRWSRLASAPIRTLSSAGLPTTILASRLTRAPVPPGPRTATGTKARRIAVHFWPGLDRHLGDQLPDVEVELRRARRGVRAEDGAVQRVRLGVEPHRPPDDRRVSTQLPGGRGRPGEATPGPARRDDRAGRRRCRRPAEASRPAAARNRRSARPAWRSGRRSGSAGLTRLGTPAMNAGANFSSGPQTGKLNALICTATPCRGVRICWPTKVPPLPSGSTAPSGRMVSFGSSRLALLA